MFVFLFSVSPCFSLAVRRSNNIDAPPPDAIDAPQKSVLRRRDANGMDAVGARRPRCFQHRVGVEVGRRRRRPAADLDGRVGERHVLGARIGLAVDRDGVEA